nr:hypothetical protein [Actinoplanes ovalisporus]
MVDVELEAFAFVADQDDRGAAREALDELQPILDAVLFLALPRVDDQEIDAAPGEEELMGGVHDLLPAEVPQVDRDVRAVHVEIPPGDVDPLGLALVGVEVAACEPSDDRTLPDGTLPR